MALPAAEELSRWTVGQVINWLSKASLSAFRDDFLAHGIDGSKLMRLSVPEIDQKYKHVPSKKRNILKDHIQRIESSRPPPSWSTAPPQIPPRGGGGRASRPPAPLPSNGPADNGDESDEGGWSDDFRGCYEAPEGSSDDEDYLEPAADAPPPIVKEHQDAVPPPRPPRSNRLAGDSSSHQSTSPRLSSSPAAGHFQLPPSSQSLSPPEGVYEVMNDVISESERPQPGGGHHPLPYSPPSEVDIVQKPVKKRSTDQPPQGDWQSPSQPTASQVPGQEDLRVYDWYHGKIGRDHAEKIFRREQYEGMFLIRKSERDPWQPYTLVIWRNSRIWNIPIRLKENGTYAAGKFKQDETEFSSIVEMVEHFKVVSISLKADDTNERGSNTLTIAAPRN